MNLRRVAGRYKSAFESLWLHRAGPLHAERFVGRLAGLDGSATPTDLLAGLSDREYYWAMTRSHELGYDTKGLIPTVPSAFHQRNWTGGTGDGTFLQAFAFHKLVKRLLSTHGGKDIGSARILDFGCGWGRILRFFLRDVPHTQLFGCDCWSDIVEVAKRDNAWCDFSAVGNFPPTGYPDGSFDVVYLYSVFSHLSEACHLAWMEEFRRILRPGGIVVATTRSLDFLLWMDRNRTRNASKGLANSMLATESFPDIKQTIRDYREGRFCYSGTGGGGPLDESFYGEACIPETYARENWKGFRIAEVVAPHGKIDQLVFCAVKC